MGNELRYSIIYAVIRPEIAEKISVGLIMLDGKSIDIRYSEEKLRALDFLMKESESQVISSAIRTLKEKQLIDKESDLEYLSRYSNNMISFSSIQSMHIEPTPMHKDWLYRKYVSA